MAVSPIGAWRAERTLGGWVLACWLCALGWIALSTAPLEALPFEDSLTIASVLDSNGASIVPIPVYVRDRAMTPIGADAAPGRTIQGLSFSVAYSPVELVLSIEFQRTGVALAPVPTVERTEAVPGIFSWIAMFDEASDPLILTSDPPAPGDLIGHLMVEVPALPPGTLIHLELLDETSSLSNRRGSLVETTGRRLRLVDGYLGIGVSLFFDGFETGDLAAWSGVSP